LAQPEESEPIMAVSYRSVIMRRMHNFIGSWITTANTVYSSVTPNLSPRAMPNVVHASQLGH